MTRKRFGLLAAILFVCTSAAPVWADAGLTEGLTRLAKKITEFMEKERVGKTIHVGDFSAPPRLKAAGGAGLRQQIEEACKREGLQIGEGAIQIMGKFTVRDERAHEDDGFESVALRITADVLDQDDEELGRLRLSIFGDSPVQFVGGSGDIPLNATPKQREEAKRKSIDSPATKIVGVEAQSPSGQFGVEVRIRQGIGSDAVTRLPELKDDGRAFIDLRTGEEYVVRLHNHAGFESAVTLTIDGLSMFAFSDDGDFGSQVLVPAGRYVDIPGWYINSRQTDVFQIDAYSKSAAAEKELPATSIGVITATFHEAVAGSDRSPKATARGRRIEKTYVAVNRIVKDSQAVISVRYDR